VSIHISVEIERGGTVIVYRDGVEASRVPREIWESTGATVEFWVADQPPEPGPPGLRLVVKP
jgi:hypothetical protein